MASVVRMAVADRPIMIVDVAVACGGLRLRVGRRHWPAEASRGFRRCIAPCASPVHRLPRA